VRRQQQRRLTRRVANAVAHMSAAIGTSASVLEMSIDSHTFAIIERRVPVWSEDDVTEGVTLYRESVQMARRRLN
jgi:hypothetical protein